jgi:hypothetical protein
VVTVAVGRTAQGGGGAATRGYWPCSAARCSSRGAGAARPRSRRPLEAAPSLGMHRRRR